MNAKSRDFILKKLIPFIRREQGNGFAMSQWYASYGLADKLPTYDGVPHKPFCDGSVCCIGGSVAFLLDLASFIPTRPEHVKPHAKALGLTPNQTFGLFMNWGDLDSRCDFLWPVRYRRDFAKAKTAEAKANVAIRLLKRLTVAGGGILANPVPKAAR